MCDRLDAEAQLLDHVANSLRAASVAIRGMKSEGPTLLTVKEAAAHSGLSEWAIRNFLNDGTLDSMRIGNKYMIPRDALRELGLGRRSRAPDGNTAGNTRSS